MRRDVLLLTIFVLTLANAALAEMGNVNFCIDTNMDSLCDEEFTRYMELGGLTDMDLLEMAFEDQLLYDNWNDNLWAVSIEGYEYDFLPQFDGAEEVYLIDGDEVYIWFTGWQWWESCAATSGSTDGTTQSGGSQAGGSQGAGTGSGFGSTTSAGIGPTTTGAISSGYAQLTIVSNQHRGYVVSVDGVQVGTEGTGSDALDGIYTLNVAGNQQHTIRVDLYQDWRTWTESFRAGGSYTADIDIAGRIVQTA